MHFASILEGLGGGIGKSWASLRDKKGRKKHLLKRVRRATRLLVYLRKLLGGFWEVFGRLLGGFWEPLQAFGAFWKPFGEALGGFWLNFAAFVLLCAASCCIFAALVVFSVSVAVVVAVSVAVVVIVAVIIAVVVACWAWFFCVLLPRGASEALWYLLWVSLAYPCFR